MADQEDAPKLILLDQTLIVFDIEQPQNASQMITLRRHPEAEGLVAYRFLCNAPTRYIVNPNSGLLLDDAPVKVVMELKDNRFNPNHKMLIQSVALHSNIEYAQAWSADIQRPLQTIVFELGTTLISLEKACELGEQSSAAAAASVGNLIDASNTKGAERIKELENVYSMLKADIDQLSNNCVEVERLKEALNKQVDQKRTMVREMQTRLTGEQQANQVLKDKLATDEKEVAQERLRRSRSGQPQPCVIS